MHGEHGSRSVMKAGDWKIYVCASVVDDQSKHKVRSSQVSTPAIVQCKVQNQAEQALGQGLHVKGQTCLRVEGVLTLPHKVPE